MKKGRCDISFATVPTVAPGDAWSAAQHNTYIRDNFAEIWKGTTPGDLDYYLGATTKARLALTAGGVLYGGAAAPAWLPLSVGGVLVGGAAAPAWVAPPGVPALLMTAGAGSPFWMSPQNITGALHAKATVDRLTNVGIPGNSTYKDITGCTVNITTAVTCTLVVRGMAVIACVTAGNTIILRASIGATNDSGALPETSSAYAVPCPYEWYLTGVAAGTYTVKFAAWANGAGGNVSNARLAVYAFVE